jgi:carboxylesterase type B
LRNYLSLYIFSFIHLLTYLSSKVPHGSELPYLLQSSYQGLPPFVPPAVSIADIDLSTEWQRKYISFAYHLDPNAEDKGTENSMAWPKYQKDEEEVLVFQTSGQGIHVEHDLEDTRACAFLREVNSEFLR